MTVLLLACGLMGGITPAQAKDGEAEMNFHGTLRDPPLCTITDSSQGSDQIDVNFGEQLGINKVNGVNFRRPLGYQIKCDEAVGGTWALTLSLIGTAAGFDKEALVTDEQTDLGIRIYQNDKPFTPGSSLEIDLDHKPTLWAVPVKRAGVTLNEGTFGAWATLRAEYQ
jgi:type 1 fimbria pilin